MTSGKEIEVVAALIVEQGRLLATQRGSGEWKDYWEFPGGKVEPGETGEEALRREIREELAMDIHVDRLLTTIDYDYPRFHLKMHCYWCRLHAGQPTLLEHEALRWLSAGDLRSLHWLPADEQLIEGIEEGLKQQGSER